MAVEQTKITNLDKIACLGRELRLRRRVYADRIRKGLMRPAEAEREIAVMEAILDDYCAKVQPSLLTG